MLLGRNSKMKKSEGRFYDFAIPAVKTCPQAGLCKQFCYAQQGRYIFPHVRNAAQRRYLATMKPNFVEKMTAELQKIKPTHLRIHSSGDFYSREYLDKWVAIARKFPKITFYAYTKSVSLIKGYGKLPRNMRIVYSFGGKEDHLIDVRTDKHSKVFHSFSEAEEKGYRALNDGDHLIFSRKRKLCNVYHGNKTAPKVFQLGK
jgi:hypothetical protein